MKDGGFYPRKPRESQSKKRTIKRAGATPVKNVAPAKVAYGND
jgi:hypothetical protein